MRILRSVRQIEPVCAEKGLRVNLCVCGRERGAEVGRETGKWEKGQWERGESGQGGERGTGTDKDRQEIEGQIDAETERQGHRQR